MADLEALTRIDANARGSQSVRVSQLGQYSWRYTLPEKKVIRLGSDGTYCDWVVPEDRMISRFHATLEWNGAALTVTRRGVLLPDFPSPPQNQIWFLNKPVETCTVRPGEWFVIGQTRFTLRAADQPEPDAPVDGTVVQRQEERSREELERFNFANPAILLKAMEKLPNYMHTVTTEAALFKQMLKAALQAMPKADAATIVRIPADCAVNDLRITVVEQNVRNPNTGAAGEYMPSRKLVRRAICERQRSCLHVWSTNPTDYSLGGPDQNLTLGMMHQQGATPWAICTPFQDGSQLGLYVSGRLVGRTPADTSPDQSHLSEYQKFIEILVGLLEATRRNLRLTRQVALTRQAFPTGVRRYLDDPDKLEQMLQPQEKEVTVLFCDLRGYSRFAEQEGHSLTAAWGKIQAALNAMSGAVTEKGGIVAGFRGDAVLGFWGWPGPQPGQLDQAAEAALKIYATLTGWMIQRKCGLGLTHGRALAGRLGAQDLAVVDLYGPVVNLAFRLEEMTKAFGVGVVVSDAVAKQLQAADPTSVRWRLRPLGRVRPRGMNEPLTAHELCPKDQDGLSHWVATDFYGAWLGQWNEALAAFAAGRWGEARDWFEGKFEMDPAVKCYLRFMDRTNGKPPAGWDGAFTPRADEV